MTHYPKIGDGYIYTSPKGSESFRVTNVDLTTGSIWLTAECSHERAVEVLKLNDAGKTDFVWNDREKCWAVNIAWDAWKRVRLAGDESAMTKLTRLTDAFGGYDSERLFCAGKAVGNNYSLSPEEMEDWKKSFESRLQIALGLGSKTDSL